MADLKADLKIAVVGAGIIGRTHIETLGRTPGLALSAIVDPALEAGEAFGVPVCATLNDALRHGIDAVIVATPNDLHVPVALEAFDAGLPVMVEKPVANDMGAARQLIAAADTSGLPVLIGHHRRHNPIIKAAKAAIGAGDLGDLVTASVLAILPKPDSYFDVPWRREPASGGPLSINLIHEVDLLRHFWGEVREVRALVTNAGRGAPVEDAAAVILAFEAGGIATLTLSDMAAAPWSWDLTAGENIERFPAHPADAHFYAGTRAALSLPSLTLWRHPGTPDWVQEMTPQALPFTAGDVYVAQLAHFAEVVRGKAAPLVSLADGVANMAVIDAIKRAGETGVPVAPDPVRPGTPAR